MSKKILLWHGRALFICPGCSEKHMVIIDGTRGWTWNGSEEKPTFSPSVLVNSTKKTAKGLADYQAWVDGGFQALPEGTEFECVPTVCHSFVNDGRIQFLNDCTHELAGQTVDLPDWDDTL